MDAIIEQISIQARKSRFVDHASGVSARFSASNWRTMVASARRRAIQLGEKPAVPRISDLAHLASSGAGKLELDLMGSHQMTERQVIDALVTEAVGAVFQEYVDQHGMEAIAEKMGGLEPGSKMKGKVMRIEPFGAFVDIGGIEGMVHVSQISRQRVEKIDEVLKVADEITVIRGGTTVTSVLPAQVTARQLAELMVGSELPSPETRESTVTDRAVMLVVPPGSSASMGGVYCAERARSAVTTFCTVPSPPFSTSSSVPASAISASAGSISAMPRVSR